VKKFLLATIMVLVATAANAGASHEIHFQKGKECWSYQGNDRSFVGKFLSWQDITVKAFFETDDGLKDAKVKVYNLTSDRLEIRVTEAGSYPTPEGGNATFEIDVQIDRPYKNIHFHICAITENMAEPPGDAIGWVKSSDIKCVADDTCTFNDHHPEIMCATGWSIVVFNSPNGKRIGSLATTDYPNVPSTRTVMIKGRGAQWLYVGVI
jgi:hypothetical protein